MRTSTASKYRAASINAFACCSSLLADHARQPHTLTNPTASNQAIPTKNQRFFRFPVPGVTSPRLAPMDEGWCVREGAFGRQTSLTRMTSDGARSARTSAYATESSMPHSRILRGVSQWPITRLALCMYRGLAGWRSLRRRSCARPPLHLAGSPLEVLWDE